MMDETMKTKRRDDNLSESLGEFNVKLKLRVMSRREYDSKNMCNERSGIDVHGGNFKQ